MWGNRLGWTISAIILVAYVSAFGWLVRGMNTASAPTGFVAEPPAKNPIRLPVAPAAALPRMSDARDAAPLYRQAIEHYRKNQTAYEKFLTRAPGSAAGLPPSDMKGVDLLVEATPRMQMTLLSQQPEAVVGYAQNEDLIAIGKLGDAAIRMGLIRQNGNEREKKQATEYYESAFSLGAKLFAERVTYAELLLGLRLMGDTSVQLTKLARNAGDAARAEALANFNNGRLQYFKSNIEPMARVLKSIDAQVVQKHTGDVFYLAENSPEKLWRVEAILALGRMRFFVGADGRAGDQRSAERMLKKLEQESDPAIRAATGKALALTIEQYRMLS